MQQGLRMMTKDMSKTTPPSGGLLQKQVRRCAQRTSVQDARTPQWTAHAITSRTKEKKNIAVATLACGNCRRPRIERSALVQSSSDRCSWLLDHKSWLRLRRWQLGRHGDLDRLEGFWLWAQALAVEEVLRRPVDLVDAILLSPGEAEDQKSP